ncbi:maleylpyruvate isomerase family mycothiol-dependent enzyme [Nonomuraea zeae]|uniref:Maleylpyruvate isomerase family mycothiol-dependent enzyme n=1 Tax=Nonomuraea zeae TaxID=1642303 RepID=A0A5S4H344_9ACTN|nr:maleylpyruvate isomerase family mycothiol-dependent enzyme [Nonomuraea zeae]TMR39678.1 maleylpyruvate isomerase family mycothiol-dependent enzyme [Nonomuraea zeae]
MDPAAHFHREIRAFQAAVEQAAKADSAPVVPSCPGWTVADLAIHIGGVHRAVTSIIEDRLTGVPDQADLTFMRLPSDLTGWPDPANAPNHLPIPANLPGWLAEGAGGLAAVFRTSEPDRPAWTWSAEQTVGFWLRMQTIEAAVHRWDAENALGVPQPIDAELAADAISQMFEVMAPARRSWLQAPPGAGERFRFRRTDGAGDWLARFDGEDVRLTTAAQDGGRDVELAGTASDLMLFLWRRIPADTLEVRGDRDTLDRYFVLVPPL